ncbi:MAG: DJ-1/PfpI family protein [Clostridiales bacterium]|nr:DJ-1/PfpI family protein [Clostridiales bacterium]
MAYFNIILYDYFETLDAMGPAEVIGYLSESYILRFLSESGGIVKSTQQVPVETLPFAMMETSGVLLIPGGFGIRSLVNNEDYVERVRFFSEKATSVLTVCTGSALLAKTHLLDGRKATTNKTVYEWACSNGPKVNWLKRARWAKDGKYYTASGVSAGLDMIFGFVSDMHGIECANSLAREIEYVWNPDMDDDPFAVL